MPEKKENITITDRIDAVTGIPKSHLKLAPPSPKSVKIELTARCNYNCFFCATGTSLRDKHDMDFDFYKKLILDLKASGVEEVGMFYLGESFLYLHLADAVKFAKDAGFEYVFLTTNGSLSTAKNCKPLFEAGLDSLKFSFNAADAEELADTCGISKGIFDRVITNMKEVKIVRDEIAESSGKKCGLFASSILYDGKQKDKMQDAINQIIDSVDEHYFLPLYSQAGLTGGERGTKPMAGNPGRVGALRDPLPCWSCFTEAKVTWDGHLSACCFDHDGRFHMGDLKELSFMKAWHSDKFQKLRKAHLKKDVTGTACEECAAY